MPEEGLDVGEFVQTPGFDGAVFGAGIELIGPSPERKACDGIAMMGEDAQRREVLGGPDYEASVCATCSDKFTCRGGSHGENGGSMVHVGCVIDFALVTSCVDEFCGTPGRWWRRLLGRFERFGSRLRRGFGEFPFYKDLVFGNGIDKG